MFWKRISLLKVSISAFILTIILVIFFWKIYPMFLFASIAKGTFVALDIFIIIFGAIFFLEILRRARVIDSLSYYLGSISKDYRVQIILLAWFFENFIEGTAGFGTPAAVVAPLLVVLGLTPLKAVIVGLLGNSTSVTFGAAGTPIRVGMAGIDISGVAFSAAIINIIGFIVPIFMLWVITRGKEESKKEFLEALPFAVWSGIAFVVPSLLTVSLGQEFPSILGAVIGVGLVLITSKLGIFMPKHVRPSGKAAYSGEVLPLGKVLFPYGLLIVLLFLGKFAVGAAGIPVYFGISHTFNFYNPGFAFLLASIPSILFLIKKPAPAQKIFEISFSRTWEPFLVIAAMSSLVQLMIYSNQNSSGLSSLLTYISGVLNTKLLPLITPFIGALGSFLTGSATVSNIMFGKILAAASAIQGLPISKILALQLTGAAAGNIIALADILSAEAVVGLKEKTREVLKGVLLPCLIYLFLVGLIGLFLVRTF